MKENQNILLAQIAEKASADLSDLILEGNDDILTAIHKSESEAQANESKPKFSLGFKISVNLEDSTFDCDLSWNLKQSLSVSHSIDDPAQGKLEGINEDKSTVTISTEGE
jgi:hypothetical protein